LKKPAPHWPRANRLNRFFISEGIPTRNRLLLCAEFQ